MEATCTNCGASIKNVITIGGKPYGTKCAEAQIGERLPRNFSGDYDKHREKVAFDIAQYEAFKADQLEKLREIWKEALKLDRAYRLGNDWERNFLRSIRRQLDYTQGMFCIRLSQFEDHKEYAESDHVAQYGLITTDRTQSIETLSPKQISLVERICG
jgi:hypothetical protein